MVENPVLGLFSGVLAAVCAVAVGAGLFRKPLSGFTGAAKLGMAGLLGFGVLGTAVCFVGLVSSGFAIVLITILLVAIGGFLSRDSLREYSVAIPQTNLGKLILIGLFALVALRIPDALMPSGNADWDTISHQLAMAKIWLQHGRVDYLPFMHQSNIPGTANMLYMLVLPFGGQYAAKVMALFFGIFGAAAVGGLTEKKYGGNSGWWAGLALFCAPVLLFELGTAYVDVLHGYAFGVSGILAAIWISGDRDKQVLWLAALFMALALATKYTAVQSGGALGIAMVIVGFANGIGMVALRGAAIAGLAALALASPWYIRNIVNTGNPVYPFFYSVFHGRNWSEANAAAYTAEQQSFGIGQTADGRKSVVSLPGSIAALSLRPDAHINQGTPTGAVGVPFLLGLIWWPLSGLRGKGSFEKTLLVTALVTLITWFFLTQQSRYIMSLIALTAPLLGGAIVRLPLGALVAVAVSCQAAYSVFLGYLFMPVMGDRNARLAATFDFYNETQKLNELGKAASVKVAMFDEVRGYYLDVPYFWANPGHHTLLPYESYREPQEIVEGLKSLGTTHLYLGFSFLGEPGQALARAYDDPSIENVEGVETFRLLLLQATRQGLLEPVEVFRYRDGRIKSLILKIP